MTAAAAASPEMRNCKTNTSPWEPKRLGASHLRETVQHAGKLEPVSAPTCDKQTGKESEDGESAAKDALAGTVQSRALTDRS